MDTIRNVVLITLDALRADHLSAYGYTRETSPFLDTLSDESVQFANAFSASSHTREAVPSILTGQYPDRAVDGSYHRDAPTIADRLQDAGFHTAGFHSNPFVSRAYGFDDGFDTFNDDLYLGQNKLVALAQRAFDKLRNRHYARADEINERSLDWLDSLDNGPFFLWNHYMDPHGPYEAPARYQRQFHGEVVSDRTAQKLYHRAIDDPDSITDEERQLLVDLYDAEIAYTDDRLSDFFDALADRDLLSDTLVLVTADHGDAFGEHDYYEHPRYLHDELVRVPLLVNGPGLDGTRIEVPASTLDVATTALRAAGDSDVDLPGEDLVAVSQSPDDYADRTVFSQARGEDEHEHLRRYSARSETETVFGEFDIETETTEINEDAPSALADPLRTFIEARCRDGGLNTSATESDEVDESIDDRLSALGYK